MNPDRDLAQRLKAGDEGALSEVIQRFGRPLYGAVYPMLLDPGSADDVVQESFVRFWRSLERFDPTRPIFPWLRRIASNLALSRLADRRREPVPVEDAPEPASHPDVEERLMEAEERRRIEAAMARLEPGRRAALALRAIQGLSYAEIAETLGISLGTVMSRLFRARMELREALERGSRAEAKAS